MSQFMLLFHSDPALMAEMSPSQMQAFLQDWATWMEGLARKGALVSGEQLGPQSKLRRGSKQLLTDGPYSEAKESVGGYVIVNASSLDEAAELSRDCPVLKDEGVVEIRQILNR